MSPIDREVRVMLTRRSFLLSSGCAGAALLAGLPLRALAARGEGAFEVTRTEEEWQALLSPEQYAVLRQSATEHPFTSPLLKEERRGDFACAGCSLPLFSSTAKYDSRTGWPSFWAPLEDGVVGEREDRSHGMVRTEAHCARCGGHLGHIFPDGPPPTGLRYCINGLALVFKPVAA